jgi:hypothetical protein
MQGTRWVQFYLTTRFRTETTSYPRSKSSSLSYIDLLLQYILGKLRPDTRDAALRSLEKYVQQTTRHLRARRAGTLYKGKKVKHLLHPAFY